MPGLVTSDMAEHGGIGDRLSRALHRKLPFPGWRTYAVNGAVIVGLTVAVEGYRVWQGEDPYDFWTQVGTIVAVGLRVAVLVALDLSIERAKRATAPPGGDASNRPAESEPR